MPGGILLYYPAFLLDAITGEDCNSSVISCDNSFAGNPSPRSTNELSSIGKTRRFSRGAISYLYYKINEWQTVL